MLALNIIFRCFYLGLFGWHKHALDMVVEGNFLDCEDTKGLNAINGLVNLLMENNDKNAIHDKLREWPLPCPLPAPARRRRAP